MISANGFWHLDDFSSSMYLLFTSVLADAAAASRQKEQTTYQYTYTTTEQPKDHCQMITLPEQMLVANAEKKTVNPEKLTKGVQHDSDDDDGRMEMEMKREGPDYCIMIRHVRFRTRIFQTSA